MVILDLQEEAYSVSNVLGPRYVEHSIIMKSDVRRNQLLTRGFIKKLYKTPEFDGVQWVPNHLIPMIINRSPSVAIQLVTGRYATVTGRKPALYSLNLDDALRSEVVDPPRDSNPNQVSHHQESDEQQDHAQIEDERT